MNNHHPHTRRAVITLLSTRHTGSVYRDEEFGDIRYRRVARAQHVRIRVSSDGGLRATLPLFAPVGAVKRLVDTSREELRTLTQKVSTPTYVNGQQVGHSHSLLIMAHDSAEARGAITGQRIVVRHPATSDYNSPQLQSLIRDYVRRALRRESKAYLPRRLAYLAEPGGFVYHKVRYAHQSGRWGSCSTSGTISLNIALMNLPFELIDYVLIHELAHTRHMNHSPAFWSVVKTYYPDYAAARKMLKNHNPCL